MKLSAPNEKAAKDLSKRAHKKRDRMLEAIGPKSAKTLRERKRGIRRVLSDPHCIFATLVDVARKKGGCKTPVLPLVAMSNQINMWAKCSEPVWLHRKESYSPKERWHCVLGLVEATRNRLLMLVVRQTTKLLPTQFMSMGGLPAFDLWLAEQLPQTKFVFATDIPSYFDLVRRSSVLSGLPHLRPVIERVLFDVKDRGQSVISGLNDNLSKVYLANTTSFAGASSPGRGIPLGAAGSSVVSELVIKVILQAIANSCPGIHCAAHGDNLIFLIEDEQSIPSLKQALDEQVGKHVGFDVIGELAHRNTVAPSDKPFFFCGSWYQLQDGCLKKWPDELKLGNFAIKIEGQLDDSESIGELETLARSVKGWMIAYGHSAQALITGGELMSQIGEKKAYLAP